MSRIASEYLVEALEKVGVKRVYGVVGDSLNGFTDALRRRRTIDWIHMRHEEAAAFAAGAEAHLTGSLAVCAGSCGPGNLHLINGLFDCQRNGVPVLAIAAHISSSEIGIDYCFGMAEISWRPPMRVVTSDLHEAIAAVSFVYRQAGVWTHVYCARSSTRRLHRSQQETVHGPARCSWQFAGEERLQSTAMILITTGDSRRWDGHSRR